MPKDIVSKFCFFVSKCGQQVDIMGIIRDSYLFGVDWIFSFLLFWGVEMVLFGLYWNILSKMMMVSDEFLDQILGLPKSDIDKYISPSCIKLESKLMVKDIIEEEWSHRRVWARYLQCVLIHGWTTRIIRLAQFGSHWGKMSEDRTDQRLVMADR